MKKYIVIIVILVICAGTLEIIDLLLANRVSAESLNAGELSQKILKLDEENSMLESKVLQYTAFEEVASRAATLGFVESKSQISLYEDLPVAINR